MVTTITLNRKINALKKQVTKEKEIIKRDKAAIRRDKAAIKKDKAFVESQTQSIREMYETYADENLPKYLIKPSFWADITLKGVIMATLTYLMYKGMNHAVFTEVEKVEFDSSSSVDETTWAKKINEDNRNKNVVWASNKKCFISESPVWKILLEVFLQVFMRIIWAVVIKIGIKAIFNRFDWFENKISAKSWSAVTVVSGIIVTYASAPLSNKINFLFAQFIPKRN